MADWDTAMANLNRRRREGTLCPQPIIDDYASHIKKSIQNGWIRLDDTVLDVGCGDKKVQLLLIKEGFIGNYIGLDPFPFDVGVRGGTIETWNPDEKVDAAICFAVLDGTKDIEHALEMLNHVVRRSIIMLTGIGIEPDFCHTFRIDFDILRRGLPDFKQDHIDYLHPKVVLTHFNYSEIAC